MSGAVAWIDRTFYPTYGKNWDDRLLRERIVGRLAPNSVVLDFGAGAGIVGHMDFRGLAGKICGVDVDPRVAHNPLLDEGRVIDGQSIPYGDATFDLVFADNVLEHLAEPQVIFAEICRVLKPGGVFLFKTPNRWHYVPLIARLTPLSFHRWINRRRGRAEDDTFPTHYLANSRGSIRRLAATGLEVEAIELVEGRPEYLRMHPAPYAVGVVYERLVNSLPFLAGLRVVLIGALRKPG